MAGARFLVFDIFSVKSDTPLATTLSDVLACNTVQHLHRHNPRLYAEPCKEILKKHQLGACSLENHRIVLMNSFSLL